MSSGRALSNTLTSTPAMSPTTIQLLMPTSLSFFLSLVVLYYVPILRRSPSTMSATQGYR
jgi:hypothetical protein